LKRHWGIEYDPGGKDNMPGTRAGGLKAAAKNKAIYGEHFYSDIGKVGGRAKSPKKGFGSMDTEKRRLASIKGGKISRGT
jgi:general stress protein YciG